MPEKDELEYSSPAKIHFVGNSKKILESSDKGPHEYNHLIKV